jgi:hypothetical protein
VERLEEHQGTRQEKVEGAPKEGDWQVNEGEKPRWIAEGSLAECVLSSNAEQACVQKEALVERC